MTDGLEVPFRIRVGVTGHRTLDPSVDWRDQVTEAIELIRQALLTGGRTPFVWSVVSSLAEGADRVVAETMIAEHAAILEVPLPFPPDEYVADFDSDRSRDAFRTLLSGAASVRVAPAFPVRDDAYEWAGQAMVGRSDVVVALWDGKAARGTGGTADIVAFARRHGRPVVHLPVDDPNGIHVLSPTRERVPPCSRLPRSLRLARRVGLVDRATGAAPTPDPFAPLRQSLRGIETYNHQSIGGLALEDEVARARSEFLGVLGDSPAAQHVWDPIARWLLPQYVRADRLAREARRRIKLMLALTYGLPLAAVGTVAVESQFFPRRTWLFWIEMTVLVVTLAVVALDRVQLLPYRWLERFRSKYSLPSSPHQRWVSYRHLAERWRSAFYLAAVEPADGTVSRSGSGQELERREPEADPLGRETSIIRGFHESAESWMPRLFGEVWDSRPQCTPTDEDVPVIRQVLVEAWVKGQVGYHACAAVQSQWRDQTLGASLAVLFGATAVLAGLHASGVAASTPDADRAFTVLAILLPAIAAVLTALTHYFEFRRHRESSTMMTRELSHAAEVLAKTPSIRTLRAEAEEVEELMNRENREWFGLMRLRQLDLG